MDNIERLVASVRRADEKYHSAMLSLQTYAKCIRNSCEETLHRHSDTHRDKEDVVHRASASHSQLSTTALGNEDGTVLELLVVDFLVRCNELGMQAHTTLQDTVLHVNAQDREGHLSEATLAANPCLRQCMARQSQPQRVAALTTAVRPTPLPPPGLTATEHMWTEAVEPIADYFRAAVDLASYVLGVQWEEQALTSDDTVAVVPSGEEGEGLIAPVPEVSSSTTTQTTALRLAEADTMLANTGNRLHLHTDVVLALLALTLQNWAAVELCWRRGSRALALSADSQRCRAAAQTVARLQRHQQKLRSSPRTLEHTHAEDAQSYSGASSDAEDDEVFSAPLGPQVAVAEALNESTIRGALLCEFDHVQASLRADIIPLLGELRSDAEEEAHAGGYDDQSGSLSADAAALRLLSGVAFLTFGVTESYGATDAALLTLQEAIDQIQRWRASADAVGVEETDTTSRQATAASHVQAVVDRVYDALTAYVDETRSKRTAATAATAAAAAGGEKGRNGKSANRSPSAQKTRTGGARKGRRSLAHATQRPLPPPPPLGATLRCFMRHGGVPVYVAGLVTGDAVRRQALARAGNPLPLETLTAPLVSCLATSSSSSSSSVVALVVCATTPLQLAAELERYVAAPSDAAGTGGGEGTTARSVWSTATLAPLLQSPLPPALRALARREGKVSGGVRALLPTAGASSGSPKVTMATPLFTPKPMSKKALAEAQQEVATAVRVLGQRLGTLLKVERAFEAQWSATETVKAALMRYYVPQACRAWRDATLLAQRAEIVRRDHSARVVTRFVRYLASEKPHLHGAVRQRQHERDRQDAAATVLQKYVRRWLAKQAKVQLLREKQRFLHDLVLVQSLYRGRQTRAWYAAARATQASEGDAEAEWLAAHFAATVIQRVYRGHATRLALLREAGYSYVAMRLHYSDSRHYCATLIQKRVRGMLVRRVYGKAVRARCLYGRNVYRASVLEASCLRIQRWYRTHRARRQARQRRKQIEDAKRWEEGKAARTWPVPALADRVHVERPPPAQITADADDSPATAVCRSLVLRKRLEQQKVERAAAVASRRGETYAPFNVDERVF